MQLKKSDILLQKDGFFFLNRKITNEEETYLRKAGLLHRVVGVPNPKVLRFWQSEAKVKALFGANRAGKTEASIIEAVWYLLGEHPFRKVKPPTRVRYMLPDYSTIEATIKPKILRYLSPQYLAGGSWEKAFSKRFHTLTLSNGSVLDFKSHLTPVLSLEGVSLHLVVIDEECPYEAYKSLLLRTVDTDGQILITATPLKGLTWMWSEIYEKADNILIFKEHLLMEENAFLDEAGVQRIVQLIDDPSRLRGEFFDNRVFPFATEALLTDEPIAGGTYYCGFDFGVNCPSALVVVRLVDDTVIVEDTKTWRNIGLGEVLESAIDFLRTQGYTNGGDLPLFIYDSALNAKDSSGFPPAYKFAELAIPALPSTKKVKESIGVLNSLMRDRRLLFRDRYLLNKLRALAYSGDNELPRKGDDEADALRYVVYHFYETGLLRLREDAPASRSDEGDEDEPFVPPSASALATEAIRLRRRQQYETAIGYGKYFWEQK